VSYSENTFDGSSPEHAKYLLVDRLVWLTNGELTG